MASDNTQLNPGSGGDVITTEAQSDGSKLQVVQVAYGPKGGRVRVDAGTPFPVVDAGLHTDLLAVLAKLSADPATQAGLAAVLAKLTADPSTGAGQTSQGAKLDTLHADNATLATQATLAAVLAKLSADPSTGASQTTQATKLDTLHADLAHLTDGTARFKDAGTFAYASGVAAASVDVPTGARIRRVSVLPSVSLAATLVILGGPTITIPPGGYFDETIPGDAVGTSAANDVVIGGGVQTFYVGWTI